MTVRTRIAPSPTGDPHVGTAYIGLFNYCFAKQHGGSFILRIEDTDQERSTLESEQAIMDSLRWIGLPWDEGPDVGGPYGPYRQSERSEIYREHVEKLIEKGHAFRCFCDAERLAALREEQRQSGEGYIGYDGHCKQFMGAVSQERADAGESYVVRMDMPREGTCRIDDAFRGVVEIDWATVDYQVLLKSDGLPTYHLANVVDDHLMKITHVMRGEEWITSAPKHLKLYEFFGWEAPQLAHLPLLRNADKSKLSKRKNPTSIRYFERMGYLPEALLNYLGMMAWSMPDGEELFSVEQMTEHFSLERVVLGGPVFDIKKLAWLNGRYIRESLDDRAFAEAVRRWALNEAYLTSLIPLVKQRIDTLSELGPLTDLFFSGHLEISKESFDLKKLSEEELLKNLQFTLWRLEALRTWNPDTIAETLKQTAEEMQFKLRDYLKPLFVAISGKANSTPLFDSMALLGPDLTRGRLRDAIEAVGGISGKALKRWEKEYRSLGEASTI